MSSLSLDRPDGESQAESLAVLDGFRGSPSAVLAAALICARHRDPLMNLLNGYKSYLAAAGMLVLAAFQAYTGHYIQAAQLLLHAAAVVGLRHAIGRPAA